MAALSAPIRTVSRLIPLIALGQMWASPAAAAPGQATRLGGVGPQGPATRAVTALHHNPAMLAGMRGTAARASIHGGIDQLWARRYLTDSETGAPDSAFAPRTSLLNPGFGYFAGASFYFDPLAVAVGMYDLSSQYRLASADPLRFHLAPDPDAGCILSSRDRCPPNGGSVTVRQDLTVALAWNLGTVQIGGAVHFPRLRQRFAFDNDTELTSTDDDSTALQCQNKEDPRCAERAGFKGWTYWIPRDGAPGGFDAAITAGISVEVKRDTLTLGARYRSFPFRRSGEMALGGVALVCRPDAEIGTSEGQDTVAPCEVATTVQATLREDLPQEVAVGASVVLGRSRLWRIDTNFYWIDYCRGGFRPASCPNDGQQRLTLVGLAADSSVLSEFVRYRGLQDLYGLDIYGSYRARSNASVLFATHLSSPSVRRSATNASGNQGWQLGISLGAQIRIRESSFQLIPGYGVDMTLPRNVTGGRAGFDPEAATEFATAGGDLNAPGAEAVLEGRARPTNAARYFGLLHTFSLAVRWGETGVRQ